MTNILDNIDSQEVSKFNTLAARWWDPAGDLKTLHAINPLRMNYIQQQVNLLGKKVLDIGCGGGILTESLARTGTQVMGIDIAEDSLKVARLHAKENNLTISYELITTESLAARQPQTFDVITCLELLEHVPDPASIVAACAQLIAPGGKIFFSTLNRNLKSYLFAIIGAEYLLKLIPQGTHEYAKFIQPAELAQWARANHLSVQDITGLSYNPLTQHYKLSKDIAVNYLMTLEKK